MRLHTAIVIAGVLSFASPLLGREWTDHTGRHRAEAELVGREGNIVVFQDPAGFRRIIEFRRLSAADQAFVNEHEHQRTKRASASQKKGLVVNTLGYRRVKTAASGDSQSAAKANTSVFKLTGWSHCTPWYCHHPHPHPQHPPKPPLTVPSKRIYHGHWSTWHLVYQSAGNVSGSGSYLITLPSGTVVRHLVLLAYVGLSGPNLHYQAVAPLPPHGIPHWRFANSAVGHCWYQVQWSTDAQNWYFYEYCQVKLPL